MTWLLMCTIAPINSSFIRSHTNFLRSTHAKLYCSRSRSRSRSHSSFRSNITNTNLKKNKISQKYIQHQQQQTKMCARKSVCLYRIRTFSQWRFACKFHRPTTSVPFARAQAQTTKCAVSIGANFFDARIRNSNTLWWFHGGCYEI